MISRTGRLRFVVVVAALFLRGAPCLAVIENWVLDPQRSSLRLSGMVGGEFDLIPQSAGSDVASFGGYLRIDRDFDSFGQTTLLSFGGGSFIDALPFGGPTIEPSGFNTDGDEDNYGVAVDLNGGMGEEPNLLFGGFRDLRFDITGGTASVSEPALLSFRITEGVINQGVTNGSAFQPIGAHAPVVGMSEQPVTLEEEPGGLVLTVPVEATYAIPLVFELDESSQPIYTAFLGFQGELVATLASPGDSTGDGVVDLEDFADWSLTYGSNADLRADFNADGVINAIDYTVWRDSLSSQQSSALPEPSGALLVVAGLAVAAMARGVR